MDFDVFNKKPQAQSFDANAWRHDRMAEQNYSSSKTNLILGLLVVLMLIIFGGLYVYNSMATKRANRTVPQIVHAEMPEHQPALAASASVDVKASPAVAKIENAATKLADIKSQSEIYRQTTSELAMCGSQTRTVLKYYRQHNEPKYKKLRELRKKIRAQKGTNSSGVGFGPNSEIANIKTQGDAMKFVLSGGASRHMAASMDAMANMSSAMNAMDAAESKHEQMRAKTRDKNHCSRVASKAQTGKLNIKVPKI